MTTTLANLGAIWLLLIGALSPIASASCVPGAPPASANEIRSILRSALQPHVHVLQRNIYFYSWMSSAPSSSAEQDFRSQAGQGEGLFAAADPLSSIDFGGTSDSGALLRIGVQ